MKTKMPLDVATANPLCEPINRPGTHGVAFVPSGSRPGVPWHVVYTKPQSEVLAEVQLRQQKFCAWAPLENKVLRDKTRKFVPLFPRYIFVQFDADADPWGVVLNTRGVSDVLRSSSNRPLDLPAHVLEALIVQCAPNGIIYSPEPREIGRGDTGKVVLGPFSEFTGIVSRTSRDRVWLLLNVLGRPTETEFKRAAVELVA